MSSLISTIFQPDQSGGETVHSTTISGEGQTGVEASPSIGVEIGGSYQNADGSTTEWSNDTQIGADVDLDAALGLTASLSEVSSDSPM